MPDDDRSTFTPGEGFDEEAWFAPYQPPRQEPQPPPGVVYQMPTGGGDAYRDLRNLEPDAPIYLEDPNQPAARPPRSRVPPFLVGLVVGVGLAVASVAIFQLFSTENEPAGPGTVASPTTVPTTVPPQTTSTSSTTTTTTTLPPAPSTTVLPTEPIEAVGRPLEVDDLRMASNGLGSDVIVGRPSSEALGRLVASLGPPDEDSGVIVTDGQFGACPGDRVRLVRWGPLMTVNVVDAEGDATFGGYRLDLSLGGLESRASTLSTLSGMRAGDSVADLYGIYEEFTVEIFDEPEAGLLYEIRRPGDDQALLRGPVTSAADDGIVTGIWAPDACGSL